MRVCGIVCETRIATSVLQPLFVHLVSAPDSRGTNSGFRLDKPRPIGFVTRPRRHQFSLLCRNKPYIKGRRQEVWFPRRNTSVAFLGIHWISHESQAVRNCHLSLIISAYFGCVLYTRIKNISVSIITHGRVTRARCFKECYN